MLEGLFFAAWARLLIKMLESALVIGWVRGVPRCGLHDVGWCMSGFARGTRVVSVARQVLVGW